MTGNKVNTGGHTKSRCGFVAVVGAPNVGKSTLVNRAVGVKVSIVTPKVQTTRTTVRGIAVHGNTQIIFVDTPGVFQPKRRLDRSMVAAAWQGAHDADVVLLLVDAARGIDPDTGAILKTMKEHKRKAVLVLNKVDIVNKTDLLELAARLNAEGLFSEVFMISAETGDGVDDLLAYLAGQVPEGPWLFPEEEITDAPSMLLAAEITREKLYLQLSQELPYSATVETEIMTEQEDGSVRFDQVIFVQRESQRKIVLGKGGRQIKSIGAAARKEMEEVFDRRVHLFLFVKVRKEWGEDPERFRFLGLDYNV